MDNNFEQRQSCALRSTVTTSPTRISTALVNDSTPFTDGLNKSRITNLPNYKRTDLGENIQFIVIFQTIEIQRLSHEIELLRVKFRQAQRQLFNAQNFEVQIRQLTEKCFNYESMLEDFRAQYEKLNKICQSLYQDNENLKSQLSATDFSLGQKYDAEKQRNCELLQEIQKWKTRCFTSEMGRDKELQELRIMMQGQRKSIIDREMREITIRFENERSNLEHEISKHLQLLEHREAEVEEGRQKISKCEAELIELRLQKPVISEYEHRMAILSNQVIHLTDCLNRKQQEIQILKKQENQLSTKLEERSEWGNQNILLKETIEEKSKQIEQWRIRTSKLEEEAIRGKEMLHYNNQLTGKLDLASKELERMNNLLRIKLEEVEKWKQKLNEKEEELAVLGDLDNELAQQQTMANMIRTENDRLHAMLRSRLQEIEAWKGKNADLQVTLTKFCLLQKEKMLLQDRFNSHIKDSEQLKTFVAQLEADNGALRKFEQRCRDIESKNQLHLKELERMNATIQNKEHELVDYSQKLSRYEEDMNEYRHSQILLKDNETKILIMEQEMGRLNGLIRGKNDEIQSLENQLVQLHSNLTKYSNLELKIYENQQTFVKLQITIEAAQKEIQNWQTKSRAAEAKVKELENSVYSKSEEREKVTCVLRSKTQECDQLKSKVNIMENELKKSAELQVLCEQLHKQSMIHLNDLQNMEKRAVQNQQLFKKERSLSQQLKSKLIVSASQLDRLTKELKTNQINKIQELSDLQKNYDKLHTCLQAKDKEIDVLTNKMAQLQAQCAAIMIEFNRLLEAAMESFEQSVTLGQKIEEYQDYARRIHILNSEIDRLTLINNGLEEDIRDMRLKYARTANTEKQSQNFELILVLMAAEIDSLRGRLDQRQASIEEMRKSILDPIRKVK